MLEALSKSVLLFLIAPILVELRPTKKVGQNVLNRGSTYVEIAEEQDESFHSRYMGTAASYLSSSVYSISLSTHVKVSLSPRYDFYFGHSCNILAMAPESLLLS